MSARNCGAEEHAHDSALRRGPWAVEEDTMLIHYIASHGEGRWNSLARCSGLKRTGKSCRLRWLNYLKPDIKRGNLTPQEKSTIFELHSKWGNRWSKIAQHLPGRTDNEIKNYWRTRMQNQARQLKRIESDRFLESVRGFWAPVLKSEETKGDRDADDSLVSESSTSINSPQLKNRHHCLSSSSPSRFTFPSEGGSDSVSLPELKIPDPPTSPGPDNNVGHYDYMYPSDPEFYQDLSFAMMSPVGAAAADHGSDMLPGFQVARDDWMAGDDMDDTGWNTDELWQFR